MQKTNTPQPAIFYDVNGTHRADTCEPLKAAKERKELHLGGFSHGCYPGHKLPTKMLPELCVSCFWDAKKDQNWGLPKHRNEGMELGYLTRGTLDFIVDDKIYKLKAGDLTVTRPWQPHQVGNPNVAASRMHWLIIDVGVRRPNDLWTWPGWINFASHDIKKLTELLSYNEHPVWRGNASIEKCFEDTAKCVETHDPQAVQTRIQLHINQLFLEVYEMLQKKNIKLDANLSSTRRSVEMFLSGLNKHLDYPWTLDAMARHCNLGRSRFSYYCKRITNMTPADYLIHCRIEKAKKLLKKKQNLPVSEVAYKCGFETSQYFSTVFRKKTGSSPRQHTL